MYIFRVFGCCHVVLPVLCLLVGKVWLPLEGLKHARLAGRVQASFFGTQDGPGQSLVYYFALPEGWEPAHVNNAAAVALLQRLAHNGREDDGCAFGHPRHSLRSFLSQLLDIPVPAFGHFCHSFQKTRLIASDISSQLPA